MNAPRNCGAPLPLPELIAYWLGELGEEREAELEAHLFGCDDCSGQLDELVRLRDAVRVQIRRGILRAVLTEDFVRRLDQAGLRLRLYTMPAGGSVNCSVAPEDDLVIARLEADLRDVGRVDALLHHLDGGGDERLEDLPVGAARDTVIIAPRIDDVRALPASTARVRLVAVEDGGERILGDYTFNHTPHSSR